MTDRQPLTASPHPSGKATSRHPFFLLLIALLWSTMVAGALTGVIQPAVAQDGATTYTVVAGDTLGAIASQFGTTISALTAANGLADPNALRVGQELIIPPPAPAEEAVAGDAAAAVSPSTPAEIQAPAYVPIPLERAVRAQPGESLRGLAVRVGQDPALVAEINGLPESTRLFPGQQIALPEGSSLPGNLRFGSIVSLDVTPRIIQGRTARVLVGATRTVSLSAEWAGTPLTFTPLAVDGTVQFALAPTSALLEPGTYPLTVTYWTQRGVPVTQLTPVVVESGDYDNQVIQVPPEKAGLLAPDVVQPEAVILADRWSVVTDQLWWTLPFLRPVEPQYETTSPYGIRRVYSAGEFSPYHAGQDFGAPEGVLIMAPAPGIVVLAEPLNVRGNAVIIDHGRGIYTNYWHMSEIKVTAGQQVATGDVIGLLGNTGLSTGAHLHWELRIDGVAVDPMQFVDEAPY